MNTTLADVTFTKKLMDYKHFRPYSDIFIETGTAAGDGVQRAIDAGFTTIASIEAAEYWFKMSAGRFAARGLHDIVYLTFGKSTDLLYRVVNTHCGKEKRAIIFLDAHPSGPLSAGHSEWLADPGGEASQHAIIQAELRVILAHRHDHVIIIDDVNGMSDGCAQQYMDTMLAVNPNYKFSFWDENLSGDPAYYYHEKILVAIP